MPYEVTYTLQDENSQKTQLTVPLGQFGWVEGDPLEFNLVISAANQIMNALADVTQANIIRRNINYVVDFGGGDGLGDIADEVYMSARMDLPNPAYWGVRIPCPIPDLIQSDGIAVNRANTDLVAYLEQLQQHGRFGASQTVELADPPETLTPYVRSTKRKRK